MIVAMSWSKLLHKQQCQNNPFIISPLLDNFGYLSNKQFAWQVIKVSYIALPGTSKFAIEFLNTLQWPPSLEEIYLHLTTKMSQSGWVKNKKGKQPPNHQNWVLIIIKPHV